MNERDKRIIDKMIQYCTDVEMLLNRYNHSYDLYTEDISFQYSCNMCIIQIGELVTRISDDFISANEQIPWHAIKGMRNLHAHDYENVDLEMVWTTLTEEIPDLKQNLEKLSK